MRQPPVLHLRASPNLHAAIQHFADVEDLSLAGAARHLVKAALRAQALWPPKAQASSLSDSADMHPTT
jgi:hypothetical protein